MVKIGATVGWIQAAGRATFRIDKVAHIRGISRREAARKFARIAGLKVAIPPLPSLKA